MSISSKFFAILLLIGFAPAFSSAQTCTHDSAFYEANHYTVGRIRMISPLDFIFLVRQRFDLHQKRTSSSGKESILVR